MRRHPERLSNRPDPLEIADPRGDVLGDVLGAVLVRNVLYRRLDCGRPWGLQVPALPRAVFHIVARGEASLELPGEPPHTLSAGDVALVARGDPHVLRDGPETPPTAVCDGRSRPACGAPGPRRVGGSGAVTSLIAGFFHLGSGPPPALLADLPRVVALGAADPAAGPWVPSIVQLIIAESAAPGPASAIVLQRLSEVLFVHTLRALASRPSCRERGLPALADPPIHRALTILHAQVAAPWTVAGLAAKVGLSRSAFAARFTRLVGEPPLQYLARWRVARAAEMLRDTEEPIGQVAARVGYASVPSFAHAFRRWQGQPPGAYRGAHRAAAQGA